MTTPTTEQRAEWDRLFRLANDGASQADRDQAFLYLWHAEGFLDRLRAILYVRIASTASIIVPAAARPGTPTSVGNPGQADFSPRRVAQAPAETMIKAASTCHRGAEVARELRANGQFEDLLMDGFMRVLEKPDGRWPGVAVDSWFAGFLKRIAFEACRAYWERKHHEVHQSHLFKLATDLGHRRAGKRYSDGDDWDSSTELWDDLADEAAELRSHELGGNPSAEDAGSGDASNQQADAAPAQGQHAEETLWSEPDEDGEFERIAEHALMRELFDACISELAPCDRMLAEASLNESDLDEPGDIFDAWMQCLDDNQVPTARTPVNYRQRKSRAVKTLVRCIRHRCLLRSQSQSATELRALPDCQQALAWKILTARAEQRDPSEQARLLASYNRCLLGQETGALDARESPIGPEAFDTLVRQLDRLIDRTALRAIKKRTLR